MTSIQVRGHNSLSPILYQMIQEEVSAQDAAQYILEHGLSPNLDEGLRDWLSKKMVGAVEKLQKVGEKIKPSPPQRPNSYSFISRNKPGPRATDMKTPSLDAMRSRSLDQMKAERDRAIGKFKPTYSSSYKPIPAKPESPKVNSSPQAKDGEQSQSANDRLRDLARRQREKQTAEREKDSKLFTSIEKVTSGKYKPVVSQRLSRKISQGAKEILSPSIKVGSSEAVPRTKTSSTASKSKSLKTKSQATKPA